MGLWRGDIAAFACRLRSRAPEVEFAAFQEGCSALACVVDTGRWHISCSDHNEMWIEDAVAHVRYHASRLDSDAYRVSEDPGLVAFIAVGAAWPSGRVDAASGLPNTRLITTLTKCLGGLVRPHGRTWYDAA